MTFCQSALGTVLLGTEPLGGRRAEQESAATRGRSWRAFEPRKPIAWLKRAEVSSGGAFVPTGTLPPSAIPVLGPSRDHSDLCLVSLAPILHPHREFSVRVGPGDVDPMGPMGPMGASRETIEIRNH